MQTRAVGPQTRVSVRADSGLARDALMRWGGGNGTDFRLGTRGSLVRSSAKLVKSREETRQGSDRDEFDRRNHAGLVTPTTAQHCAPSCFPFTI
jgi:hypothetical protein